MVVVCVWCVCVRVLRHAEKTRKNPFVDSDTPPCVHSKRPHVCWHHAHMCFKMCAWCRYTRGRFERTCGGVFESTYGGGRRQFCLPRKVHVEFSLGPTEVHQRNPWILHIFSLRMNREQHVSDSSNHSLHLIKPFNLSNIEGNFGGDQQPDGSISLSPSPFLLPPPPP